MKNRHECIICSGIMKSEFNPKYVQCGNIGSAYDHYHATHAITEKYFYRLRYMNLDMKFQRGKLYSGFNFEFIKDTKFSSPEEFLEEFENCLLFM